MKTLVPLIAAALLAPSIPQAGPVYRCVQNGVEAFTDEPGPNCVAVDLKVIQPDPEEVARQQARRLVEEQREREEQEQQDKERAIRAQEDTARAAERQADAQRRMAEQQRYIPQTMPPAYYPSGLWPGYGYGYRVNPLPLLPQLPPVPSMPFLSQQPSVPDVPYLPTIPLGPMPSNDAYPYGVDQGTLGGGGNR